MHTDAPASKLLPSLSLVSGVLSIILLCVFLFSMLGNGMLLAASAFGIVGLILGIVALRRRQTGTMAIAGLVFSALCLLGVLALVVFALLFVGALTLNPM